MLMLKVATVLPHIDGNYTINLESDTDNRRWIEGTSQYLRDLIHEYNEIVFDKLEALEGTVLNLPKNTIHEEAPIACFGGSIDECSAALKFIGEDLDPDTITMMLGCTPTTIARKGDIRRSGKYIIKKKEGVWLHKIENPPASPLENKIKKIFEQTTNDLSVWARLTNQHHAELHCSLTMREWNRELRLSPMLLKEISDRNLNIFFDIYNLTSEESEENE